MAIVSLQRFKPPKHNATGGGLEFIYKRIIPSHKLVNCTSIYCCHSFRPTELARTEQSCRKKYRLADLFAVTGISPVLLLASSRIVQCSSEMRTHLPRQLTTKWNIPTYILPESYQKADKVLVVLFGWLIWPPWVDTCPSSRLFCLVDIMKTEEGFLFGVKDSLQT